MTQPTKVSFISSWNQNSDQLLEMYKKQTPDNSGIWGDIQGTQNIKEAEYLISMGSNTNIGNLGFESNKIIEFRREPDFISSFKSFPNTKRTFDYSKNSYHVCTWHFILESFDELIKREYEEKTKKMSTICSPKWNHRNKFLKEVSKQNTGQIDMFGPPSMQKVFGANYRPLHPKYKDAALNNYEYSIAIENSQQDNYFSEKLIDCYLFWTMPIYWGCPNISEFFPENSYYVIDLARPEDIKEIIKKPIEKKHIDALKEARNLVLYKYNIWPTVAEILK